MADWPYNTKAWQRLRLMKLRSSPLCEECHDMDMVTPANTVDHRVAISDGGNPFPTLDGLASYCASCHSAKTARGSEAGAIKTTKPRKGCNPDGTPLDRRHPWHAKHKPAKPLSGARKSLRADASGPTPPTNFELVSFEDEAGEAFDPFPSAPLLDDGLDDLWG
jgi:5-methylcytosine-specific restriction enzyme A